MVTETGTNLIVSFDHIPRWEQALQYDSSEYFPSLYAAARTWNAPFLPNASWDHYICIIHHLAPWPVPLTTRITLPNCLLRSSFSTSWLSSTSPHLPVCHRTSRLHASAACSMPNLSLLLCCSSSLEPSKLRPISSFRYSLHSQTSLAATHRLFPASTALSNPTNSQAGSPAIQPLITALEAGLCDFGKILPSSRVGFSSMPGHTLCVRYARIGLAIRTCRSLKLSPCCASVGGGGAQQSSVSVSKYRSNVLMMSYRIP